MGIGKLKRLLYKLYFREVVLRKYKHRRYFINKKGFEVGGPSEIFKYTGTIPAYHFAKKIDNINFSDFTTWEKKIAEGLSFKFTDRNNIENGYQYIGEASDLGFLSNGTYDFLLSSHCIEHLANPIQGLMEWVRVVKKGGVLVIVFPHKEGTFDHKRPVTSLAHLIDDYNNNTDEKDLTHLEEILALHDLNLDLPAGNIDEFKKRSLKNYENRCLHQHVFDPKLAIELIDYMNLEIVDVVISQPFNIEIIAKKLDVNDVADNSQFLSLLNIRNDTTYNLQCNPVCEF